MRVLMASLHLSRGQPHSIDCLSVIALSLPVRAVACLVFLLFILFYFIFFRMCLFFSLACPVALANVNVFYAAFYQ